jgi:hypothetical protein
MAINIFYRRCLIFCKLPARRYLYERHFPGCLVSEGDPVGLRGERLCAIIKLIRHVNFPQVTLVNIEYMIAVKIIAFFRVKKAGSFSKGEGVGIESCWSRLIAGNSLAREVYQFKCLIIHGQVD